MHEETKRGENMKIFFFELDKGDMWSKVFTDRNRNKQKKKRNYSGIWVSFILFFPIHSSPP